MTADLYGPFLEATRSVFGLMLDLSDISEGPAGGFECADGIDISIPVTGDLSGEVIYRFPRETSINMVKIMSGMDIGAVDDFVTSAISEIANIISGNVLTALSGDDLKCDLLPPVARNNAGVSGTALCISTSAGDVCLDIRLASAA